MAAIAVSVAEKVEKKAEDYLVALVCRHCGYLIFSSRNIRQLKGELEKLKQARRRVEDLIEEAKNNSKDNIQDDVTTWMGEVETVTNHAGALLPDHDGRGNKTCFYGWFPNPKERHRLGEEASKMVKEIPVLIGRGQFPKVYYENPPPGVRTKGALIISAGHHGGTIIESRTSILEGIMNALDDENLKVIGIYGPGGVGKTTLLGEVEEKLRNEKRPFHMIATTKVSQTPDVKKIQDDIAYALGLNLKDEQSEVGRRDLLYRKLQSDLTEKILIILDDLWKKLDLEVVGIPSGDESSKCKLLLTSRFKDVLIEMKCAPSTSIFHLQGLKDEEAFRLFEEKVGDRLKEDEDVRAIAPQVVKKLAGLPLLINSVANYLKDNNLSAWRTTLKKLDESNNKSIFEVVKLSYDRLSENAKTLFRVCGLIGGTIEVQLLLGIGMGLGLFEESNNTREEARDELNTMLDSLRSVCLLQDGGDDEEKVTIHDLYSEVVVSTQLGAQDSLVMNSNYGSWPKEKREKCWAIHLPNVGRDKLAELTTCQFPELKILMLSQPGDWRWESEGHDDARDCCGPLDFKYMKELRVLYLRSMHFGLLPYSIEILVTLRSLYLEYCDVEDVAIVGKLKTLEILSFAGSTFSTLPKEIGGLTKLRSLNLNGCSELRRIERGALKGLTKLEELLMKESFDEWMGEDKEPSESCNARLAELKSLTKLTAVEISILDPALLLEDGDLPFGNLIRFWIKIGNLYGNTYESSGTMMLNLRGFDSILSKEWVQKTLQRTRSLFLRGLSKESAHELCSGGFSQLKHLIINRSTSIKYIALSAFPSLESLHLENLDYLEMICDAPGQPECSSKLKYIKVKTCHRLKNLGCLSNQQRLVHLEEIEVKECESMQAIITYDARNVGAAVADVIVELPNVRKLDLNNLPSMTSFCIGDKDAIIQLSLPCLEKLWLDSLGSLQKFCIIGGLHKLRDMIISNCSSLESLVDCGSLDSNTEQVMSFHSLENLCIVDCPNVVVFVRSPINAERPLGEMVEENDESTQPFFNEMLTFPNITELQIQGIRSEELWNNQIPHDSFCKLKSLSLGGCDKLRHITPSCMWKRLQHCLEILRVILCPLIEVIYEGDGTNVESSKLRTLVMRDLNGLKHIWRFDGQPNVPFPNLRKVEAVRCSRLEILFASFTEKFLGQMEELVVESCEDMKLIADREEGEAATSREITFLELTALRLLELPQFRSFLPEKYSPNFLSLRVLNQRSCGNEPDKNLGD